ncbi:MAG: 3-dehydroquinate synthase [Pirellulaceae bacterium]
MTPRGYQIDIGRGLLAHCATLASQRANLRRVILITDANVAGLHGDRVAESLRSGGSSVELVVVPAGEASKSTQEVDRLWQAMLAAGADRKTTVVALGGGVVGDLAGFAAASFARGIPFVQIPTTLLAQVDSSVGGKVGINLPGAKNMVGAFWQPHYVLIDIDVLQTLPDRDYRCGLAEVVKYGVILDADFFAFLEDHIGAINRREPVALGRIIARSCQLKADVVLADERETSGLRAILNYGHTFGHALEAITGYGSWLHGEAIAVGMLCASRLAESLGRVDSDITKRQEKLLKNLGLPTQLPQVDLDAMIQAMQFDKKMDQGNLRFILPDRMGAVSSVGDVPVEHVRAAMVSTSGRSG